MSIILRIEDLHKSYRGQPVVDGASWQIDDSDRWALVGRNGAGKSTLIRLLLGQEESDLGEVWQRPGSRIAHLRQDDPFLPDETVATFLERIADAPAWRCAEVAAKLGVGPDRLIEPAQTLPGGVRTRVQLAGLLIPDPDFIICDEPTNFLDLRTQFFLERMLQELRVGLLVVSHDIAFLDAVTKQTADLQAGQLTCADMTPSKWLEEKEARREHARRANVGIAAKRAQLEQFVASNKANANTASQARSKAKQLERLQLHAIDSDDASRGTIRFPPLPERDGPAIVCSQLVIGYGNKKIASADDLVIDRGEHLVVLGDNGQGKTTFLRTLCGDLAPVSGDFRLTHNERIGVYAQHVHQALPTDLTVHQYLRGLHPGSDEESVLAAAGGFGFHDLELQKKIAVLSGGERARLALAGLFLDGATILLLDEPTNHLDIATVAGLTAAIDATHATVLVITHDRRLATAIGSSVLAVGNGTVQRDPGGVTGWLQAAREQASGTGRESRGQPASSPSPTATSTIDGATRYKLQKEQTKLERQVGRLQEKQSALGTELAETADGQRVQEISALLQVQADEIDSMELRLLEIMEALDE